MRLLAAPQASKSLGGSGTTYVEVGLGGGTKCTASVTADLVNVAAQGPQAAARAGATSAMKNEGSIFFDVTLGGMAAAAGAPSRRSTSAYAAVASTAPRGTSFMSCADAEEARIVLCRGLERMVREGRAIDLEALSVIPGKVVWSVRCDVRVLDNCGNVAEAVSLAALAGLQAHRLPEVGVEEAHGSRAVTVFPPEQREASPLPLHFTPVTIGFAILSRDGETIVVDPDTEEEAASDGTVHVSMNAQGEVCGMTKVRRRRRAPRPSSRLAGADAAAAPCSRAA